MLTVEEINYLLKESWDVAIEKLGQREPFSKEIKGYVCRIQFQTHNVGILTRHSYRVYIQGVDLNSFQNAKIPYT